MSHQLTYIVERLLLANIVRLDLVADFLPISSLDWLTYDTGSTIAGSSSVLYSPIIQEEKL